MGARVDFDVEGLNENTVCAVVPGEGSKEQGHTLPLQYEPAKCMRVVNFDRVDFTGVFYSSGLEPSEPVSAIELEVKFMLQ